MSAENPEHHLNLGTIGWCHTKFYQVTTIIRIVWLTVRRGANLIWELKGYTQVVRDVQVQSALKGISFLCRPCDFKWLTDNNNNIISEWVINYYSHGFDFMNWLTFFFPREGFNLYFTWSLFSLQEAKQENSHWHSIYSLLLMKPFTPSQDLHSNSPYCQPYSSGDVGLENLLLDQLKFPSFLFFFDLITCLLDIAHCILYIVYCILDIGYCILYYHFYYY